MIIRYLQLLPFLLMPALAAHAQLGPPPLGGQAVTPQGAPTARTLRQKLADQLSILDFGAACDGVADDSGAVTAAAASGRHVTIPDGLVCNAPLVGQYALSGTFIGGGKIRGSDGNLRGPRYGNVTTPPNPGSANDNCSAGFTCWAKYDWSHALSAEEFHVSGITTAGQPTTGYQYMPGITPHVMFFDSNAGWNNNPGSNDGRTGIDANRIIMQQNGRGDLGAYEAEILCAGPSTGVGGQPYTDWLAVPGCGYQGGDISALAPHQYLQEQEWHFADNGFDVAVVGSTIGYTRASTTTPALNNRWVDQLSTCNLFPAANAIACDAQHVISGQWRIGLDFAELATQIVAPLAMQANQKITLNSSSGDGEGNPSKTNLGGDWITDDGYGIVLAQNGATTLRLNNPANAVNYWQFGGATTGNAIVIGPVGSDTSIPVIMSDKGGSGVLFQSNNAVAMKVSAATGATSYLNMAAGTSTSPLTLQAYGAGNQDLGLGAANAGLVRLVGGVPGAGDASTAVPTTAFVQSAARSAVTAMSANRYKIFNVGAGASITLPVPSGVLNEMIVEINPNAPTIATMSLTMPATASLTDGFIVHFISTGTVSTLATPANTGQTVLGAPGSISQTTPFAFMWDSALAQWIPFR